jgi:cellulose synthase/poly-beta-1,6-N-acetylglucosamine synthase-like glycosyltransferase
MNEIAVRPPPSWAVGVVIPARDEEDSIVACVESTLQALDACAEVKASWVVVVADSCHDLTAALAREKLAHRGTVIECSLASPGAARRCGTAEVLAHFEKHAPSELWLANTDADSSVRPDWIARQLELARQNFCGVAGVVRVNSVEGPDAALIRELLADYAIHDDGTHPHVHGANLGVRADAYLDAGGWSNLTVAEDHCLWSRLHTRGWPLISSVSSMVFTSGRLQGRAVGGFADALRRKLELRRA